MVTCGNCGQGNVADARFCPSCGAELSAACPSCGTNVPAGARFCPSCGAALGGDEGPNERPKERPEERKVVTVVFADVIGSTTLGERLDPEQLREVMASYFAAMREEIEAEGGTVEKFIGDAVMAAFGAPASHEDDPARALRSALRMQRRLDALNPELERAHDVTLQIRIGVNTGEVLATTAARPGEPMVTGDVVNVAARLQTAAEPGRIVVSSRTARAVRGFRFEEIGSLDLKGKSLPVDALRLMAAPDLVPERGIAGLHAPMVGRDHELLLLRALFGRVASERLPHLVTVYGEPGVGKSRLTAEFISWAESQVPAPIVLRGRCLPYGDGITYWPLAEILKGHAGVLDSDGPDLALEKIRKAGRDLLTPDLAPDPARATAALAYTVGVEDPDMSFSTMEPRQVRAEAHRAWRSFFSALARSAPVVAVIEDIHWADPALLDLLDQLAEGVEGPALFACPARPDLVAGRPGWGGGRRNSSSISLDPLSPAEAERLVGLLLAVDDLPISVRSRILERAEGNPFFLEEIVRQLIDEGLILVQGDRWRAATDIGDVDIPDTVQGVLAARIDLLAPEQKRALQGAAVVGRVFWPGPVRELLNGDGDALERSIEALEQRDLVRSRLSSAIAGESEFVFKHILTRDVAYDSLPRRERARAHAAVAEWIETTAGERRREFAELLAYHYQEAHRGERDDARGDAERVERLRERAFRTLLLATEDARSRYALQKAATLVERAASLARGPLERAEVLEERGTIARNGYQGDLAWSSFTEAVDIRLEHVPHDRRAIARTCAWAVETPLRWPGSMKTPAHEDEVRHYLDTGLAHVDADETEEGVRLLIARSFGPFAFGWTRDLAPGEVERAHADGERAADLATGIGRPDLVSAALDGASSALITLGLYGPDVEILERRLALADLIDDPWETADIFAMGAWAHGLIGNFADAVRLGHEGIVRGGDQSEGLRLHNMSWQAFARFFTGSWEQVDELLAEGRRVLADRADEPPYFTMHLFGAAALVHDARGDPDADRLVDVLDRSRGRGEAGGSIIASYWLVWIHSRRGDHAIVRTVLDDVASVTSSVARPFQDLVTSVLLADAGWWDEVPAFLEGSRAYAAEAGLRALPAHLDRLEGRAALAAGDVDTAIQRLMSASSAFEALGARWEQACTDLWLAETLASVARTAEALVPLDAAAPVFEELRPLRELERVKELRASLG